MSVKIKEVLYALERFAPLPLQEDYDNAGLQIGLQEAEVSGALLCLDVTESVLDEAIVKGCNLIVSHHPLIFHKLAHVSDQNYVERCVAKTIKNDLAIVSMHTNLDAARGGVNFKIAEKIGLDDVHFFGSTKCVEGVEGGQGVIGSMPEPMAADDFVKRLKQVFGVETLMTNQLLRRPIGSVALCGGAGSFLLRDALACGIDAFVTGEMHYHEYFGLEQKIQICVMGHYQSEKFTVEVLERVLREAFPELHLEQTGIDTNPILYL